ncbi:MAG: zinc transporter ZupT, partial [Microbacteriaceae bacterium]|nr:zinc transporter ZupT [Microbacteriaceae bacterium]
MDTAVAFAFLVTLGAGLATAVGAGVGLFAKHTNRQFLAIALGFSAGVMIYVSFVEILPKASDYIHTSGTDIQGSLLTAGSFLAGLAGMALMYRLIPDLEHPELTDPSTKLPGEEGPVLVADRLLFRAGLGVALAITL